MAYSSRTIATKRARGQRRHEVALDVIDARGEREAAVVLAAALAELLDLGVEGVEAKPDARAERLVDVDRVALRAE